MTAISNETKANVERFYAMLKSLDVFK